MESSQRQIKREVEPEEIPKKPRKSAIGRRLIRWDPSQDQLVLLTLEYVCLRKGITLPWDEVAAQINDFTTGEGIKQHLAKLRNCRDAEGQPVPPKISGRARCASVGRQSPTEKKHQRHSNLLWYGQTKPHKQASSKKAYNTAWKDSNAGRGGRELSKTAKQIEDSKPSLTKLNSVRDVKNLNRGRKRGRSSALDKEIRQLTENGEYPDKKQLTSKLRARDPVNYAEMELEDEDVKRQMHDHKSQDYGFMQFQSIDHDARPMGTFEANVPSSDFSHPLGYANAHVSSFVEPQDNPGSHRNMEAFPSASFQATSRQPLPRSSSFGGFVPSFSNHIESFGSPPSLQDFRSAGGPSRSLTYPFLTPPSSGLQTPCDTRPPQLPRQNGHVKYNLADYFQDVSSRNMPHTSPKPHSETQHISLSSHMDPNISCPNLEPEEHSTDMPKHARSNTMQGVLFHNDGSIGSETPKMEPLGLRISQNLRLTMSTVPSMVSTWCAPLIPSHSQSATQTTFDPIQPSVDRTLACDSASLRPSYLLDFTTDKLFKSGSMPIADPPASQSGSHSVRCEQEADDFPEAGLDIEDLSTLPSSVFSSSDLYNGVGYSTMLVSDQFLATSDEPRYIPTAEFNNGVLSRHGDGMGVDASDADAYQQLTIDEIANEWYGS